MNERVLICGNCGTRYGEQSDSIVWIGYQPFHGDCLAEVLTKLGAVAMRVETPEQADAPLGR